ncbi:MAG: ATP-binding protein, partial [Nitrospirota bacterium]|nr:ATP-binding protein [Nitrospirota bacterium]
VMAGRTTDGTSGEKGTGLGLLLCKDFVEKHGGRVWVDSVMGQGAAFHFTLPKAYATLSV